MLISRPHQIENPNTAKTERYRAKRQTTRYPLDSYLDDVRQAKIHDWLKSQPNGKEAILQAIEQVILESSSPVV